MGMQQSTISSSFACVLVIDGDSMMFSVFPTNFSLFAYVQIAYDKDFISYVEDYLL